MSTTPSGGDGDAFVYGLRFPGLAGVPGLPVATSDDPAGPAVTVRQVDRVAPAPIPIGPRPVRSVRTLTDGRVLMMEPTVGSGRVDGVATLLGPALEPADLAHPYLTPIASPFTRWNGREAFHSGVFGLHGRAWVVRGGRTAGKSSLMAALAGRGLTVLADDMAMTEGDLVHTGPRSIDLRQPVPGVDLPHRTARGATRRRLLLPEAPRSLPLGGWLFLHWTEDLGAEVELRPVTPTALLSRLARTRAYADWDSDPSQLLSLALRPAFDLLRPRRWDAVPDVIAALEHSLRPPRALPHQRTTTPAPGPGAPLTGRRS
ncbi:hypothetical protein [Nakamurella flava]|uniref:hypothetical protein n=1 Tax=Nakamurella flava TaxID=2576308 RepID=UPI00140D98DB|nr:hypothetical protein [Nakamurella flava]